MPIVEELIGIALKNGKAVIGKVGAAGTAAAGILSAPAILEAVARQVATKTKVKLKKEETDKGVVKVIDALRCVETNLNIEERAQVFAGVVEAVIGTIGDFAEPAKDPFQIFMDKIAACIRAKILPQTSARRRTASNTERRRTGPAGSPGKAGRPKGSKNK